MILIIDMGGTTPRAFATGVPPTNVRYLLCEDTKEVENQNWWAIARNFF